MEKFSVKIGVLFISLLCSAASFACTDFRLSAKDGTVIVTRSMEYAVDMQSNLRTSPRGRVFTMTAPDGKPGLNWTAKYGYVFLDGFNIDVAIDGMNEQGLTFEALYLPNLAQYQTIPAGRDNRALPYLNLGDWILSNFKSVDEVKAALPTIFVFTQTLPGLGSFVAPLHYSIYDASGKGIVVEYVNGKLSMYDNQIGILTNSPTYDWHLTNMENYVHLAPINPPNVMDNGILFGANGQGFGMIGLPGDISPPSRFVKAAVLARVVIPADNAVGLLNLSQHIINNFDIPRGLTREPQSGKYINETTQWVVFKDVTHKIFYYRTYNDTSLRSVSFDKINLMENAPRLKMPIASEQVVLDMTPQLFNAKQ